MILGIAQHLELLGHNNILQLQLLQAVIIALVILILHVIQIVSVEIKLPIAVSHYFVCLHVS